MCTIQGNKKVALGVIAERKHVPDVPHFADENAMRKHHPINQHSGTGRVGKGTGTIVVRGTNRETVIQQSPDDPEQLLVLSDVGTGFGEEKSGGGQTSWNRYKLSIFQRGPEKRKYSRTVSRVALLNS